LRLRKNQIGAEGAGRLAGVLPQIPCLSILDLFGNQIGDEGAGMQECCRSAQSCLS